MENHEDKAHGEDPAESPSAGRGWYTPPKGQEDGLFDQIVRLAGTHCHASIAILTLTEERRQWVWSSAGSPGLDPARLNMVACRVAEEPAAFAVCDTRTEPCWASDPAVHADPPIRACCGAPVLSPSGETIGFLCVLCLEPGDTTRAAEVRDSLQILARLVTVQLQFRRIAYDYEHLLDRLNQAQASLRESEEKFRMLAENAADMIARLTPAGVYLYVSPACRAQRGYEPGELIGRAAAEFIHPDDLARLRHEVPAAQAGGDITRHLFRVRRKDGVFTMVETVTRRLREPGTGAVREYLSISRDVEGRGDKPSGRA